jgi:branched-chain amino acid transport system ATP-binding protein
MESETDTQTRSRPLLRFAGVSVRFGSIVALTDISFEVRRGEILGLIGPNGAGKTTVFNCLSRLCAVHQGEIELEGRSLLALPRHQIPRIGIARTFQHVALFDSMTVRDNVLTGSQLGRAAQPRRGFLIDAFRLPSVRRAEEEARAKADTLLEQMGLSSLADTPVADLPFAVKKRVELARSLASGPKLLLLDEPAGGLNHEEVEQLGDLTREIRERFAVSIVIVEHHLNFVMRISDRVVALDFGKVLAEGTPAEMQAHPEVIRAYLGDPS